MADQIVECKWFYGCLCKNRTSSVTALDTVVINGTFSSLTGIVPAEKERGVAFMNHWLSSQLNCSFRIVLGGNDRQNPIYVSSSPGKQQDRKSERQPLFSIAIHIKKQEKKGWRIQDSSFDFCAPFSLQACHTL